MKRNSSLMLGAVSLLTLIGASQLLTHLPPNGDTHSTITTAVAQTATLSGSFVAAEHPTAGTAQVVIENGDRYLEFDSAFTTDNGPDLYVLLHHDSIPESYNENNYVSLGRLTTVSGSQRYAIPDSVDLQMMGSAVIWCRQFNATFGYAPLIIN